VTKNEKRRTKSGMFFRMLWRAAAVQRWRTVMALTAMMISATVATALLNLYADAQQKLRAEFRGYGANVVVSSKDDASLPEQVIRELTARKDFRVVPYAYVVARTSNDLRGTPVVVAGTDMAAAEDVNRSWWRISDTSEWVGRDPVQGTLTATFGARARKSLSPDGAPVELWFAGKPLKVIPQWTLSTGGDEDSRIYIGRAALQQWTGAAASTLEIAVDGTPAQIHAVIDDLQKQYPELSVQPIRQIVEGEANVLGKTRSTLLLATVIVTLTAALCVLATLLSWVLDRRRDFAVMKALGASQRLITAFFATEASLIGALGALAGFGLGVVVAMAIGKLSFGATVQPQIGLLPAVVAGGGAIALLAALTPMAMLRRIQPAAMLRGE
jgi:putative ABC transport system permease protein